MYVWGSRDPVSHQALGARDLRLILFPPSWSGVGSPSHQSPITVWSTHSHATLDAHRQHVVVETLGLQTSHLPSQLDFLPLEALQAKEGQGRL